MLYHDNSYIKITITSNLNIRTLLLLLIVILKILTMIKEMLF